MREAQELATATEADIASVAALLSDPARCKVLLALDDGRALPASVLAEEAGISSATASSHLAKLTDAGLLAVRSQGRHRYYRLAGPEVAALIEQLGRLAPARPVTSLREGTRAARLRSARTCYDHIAGRLGVQIMGRLLELEILTGGDGLFHADGADRLSAPGHDVTYELTGLQQACAAPTPSSRGRRRSGAWRGSPWSRPALQLAVVPVCSSEPRLMRQDTKRRCLRAVQPRQELSRPHSLHARRAAVM
ncbi:ArsR/SmtB family transcription factor [Mycolicibacterium goodii]|uniref:ArsR/SmtB family transcription factor n=1 Tax=Mycolicibacterium goodii TaxID=134601 RepID=UPI00256EDCA3|nr:metalloregulator ArsR/SmtB family transcription factor [Mycolicibacterium goodii]